MSATPTPRVSRLPAVPLIWVVPLIALAVAGWLIYHEWQTRGPMIEVEFADGAGIAAGRTILQHKGVTIGRVTAVNLTEDLRRVRVTIRLERTAAGGSTVPSEQTTTWMSSTYQPSMPLQPSRPKSKRKRSSSPASASALRSTWV